MGDLARLGVFLAVVTLQMLSEKYEESSLIDEDDGEVLLTLEEPFS